MTRALPRLLVPLALVLVVALPFASAHPACLLVERATATECADPDPVCDAVADAVTDAGREAAAACEDVL